MGRITNKGGLLELKNALKTWAEQELVIKDGDYVSLRGVIVCCPERGLVVMLDGHIDNSRDHPLDPRYRKPIELELNETEWEHLGSVQFRNKRLDDIRKFFLSNKNKPALGSEFWGTLTATPYPIERVNAELKRLGVEVRLAPCYQAWPVKHWYEKSFRFFPLEDPAKIQI